MNVRLATPADAPLLAAMNALLIRDEGHRNNMTVAELEVRMREWLAMDYQAAIFEDQSETVGYLLFRKEPDHIYLRQLFVQPSARRKGIGRAGFHWLRHHAQGQSKRIRLDVLMQNQAARSFWKAVGFHDYCITMEMDL